MSKKEEKTNVMRVLEQKGIPFTPHTYPHEDGVAVDGVTVARSMGQDPECVFKTLVARGASGGLYVFDIPVADTLDLKKAASVSKNKKVDMRRGIFSPIFFGISNQKLIFFSLIGKVITMLTTMR